MIPIGTRPKGDHHVALNRICDWPGFAPGRVRRRGRIEWYKATDDHCRLTAGRCDWSCLPGLQVYGRERWRAAIHLVGNRGVAAGTGT